MRFIGFAAIALLAALPAWAQTASPTNNDPNHVFASNNCSQAVACPSDATARPEDFANKASACITQNFGYTNQAGFFDTTLGLDSHDCMASIPNAIPKGVGPTLAAQCCVIRLTSSCIMRCSLVTP